jgi:hypothetical protein
MRYPGHRANRHVSGEISSRHFNLPMQAMPQLFPHYPVDPQRFRNFCLG